jgi:hypothetical protein
MLLLFGKSTFVPLRKSIPDFLGLRACINFLFSGFMRMYTFTVMLAKRIIATSPGRINVPCLGNTPWDTLDDTPMSSP